MSYSSWEGFFTALSEFAEVARRNLQCSRIDIVEHAGLRCECFLRVLTAIKVTLERSEDRGVLPLIDSLLESLDSIRSRLTNALDQLLNETLQHRSISVSVETCSRGRPRVILSAKHIQNLRELGFTWTRISSIKPKNSV